MEKEIREQIRQQINYASSFIEDVELRISSIYKNINPFKIKYTAEKILKSVVQWILIGDMKKEWYYIETCQREVIVMIRNIMQKSLTKEFENSIEQRVKELIYTLVEMDK